MIIKNNSQKKFLIVLFFVFLVLRLFVSYNSIFLGADNLKFLELSKRFPSHTLSNNQLYLQHPPLYPYAIHFFDFFLHDDFASALLISIISACITFFFLYKLFMLLSNDFYISYIAMVLFSLSVEMIEVAHAILRESFVMMLLVLSIYYYTKGIKFRDKKAIFIATLASAVASMTTDYVIFLIPVFVISYLSLGNKINIKKFKFPKLWYAILPVLAIFIVYLVFWLSIKCYHFSNNDYYPSGLEGTPVSTAVFEEGCLKNARQLIDPKSLPGYEPAHGLSSPFKNVAYNLGYMLNIEPFSIPRGLNFTTINYLLLPKHIFYMVIIYLPIAIFAIVGIFFMLRNAVFAKGFLNPNIYVILLFLIFISSLILQKSGATSPRWLIPAYPFIYYIISYGVVSFFKLLKLDYKKIISIFAILILLLIPFWFFQDRNLIFSIDKVIGARSTADFINKNIGENAGIMAQPGYNYKLIYLTGRRMVGLVPFSNDLIPLIDYYNIDYIVFGRYYTYDTYKYNADTVQFILKNPDKFKLIVTIKEDYGGIFHKFDKARTDEVYIYRVVK